MADARVLAIAHEAHAKVNLCLSIGYPPHDGYHPVRSVFQELDLCDVVRVSRLGQGGEALCTTSGTCVELDCPIAGLDPHDNLVFRALDAAECACGVRAALPGEMLRIEVEKRIPAGGGLGGGSSDAAAMLGCYARLVGLDKHDIRLVQVARSLGADVAFFLQGGCALMGGRGDVFERALPALEAPIVLMGDAACVSTADVYRAFDADPQPVADADGLADALVEDAADFERVARLCTNNLGPAACALAPRIQHRLEMAREYPGVLAALVSGSGSTSFAICVDEASAHQLADAIAAVCDWVRVCCVPPIFA